MVFFLTCYFYHICHITYIYIYMPYIIFLSLYSNISCCFSGKKFCRILSCFKLNAFEYLKLPFDSSPEDVKKQYRKVTPSFSSSGLNMLQRVWYNMIWSCIDMLFYSFPCSYLCWFTLTSANIRKRRRHLVVSRSLLYTLLMGT